MRSPSRGSAARPRSGASRRRRARASLSRAATWIERATLLRGECASITLSFPSTSSPFLILIFFNLTDLGALHNRKC